MKNTIDYDTIVREHFNRLRTPFLRYICNKFGSLTAADAEDLYQEAWIAIHRAVSRKSYPPEVPVDSYLLGVGRNMALKLLSKPAYALHDSIDEGFDADADERFCRATFEMELALRSEQQSEDVRLRLERCVDRSLKQVTSKCRDILRKFYYLQMSMREIADLTDDCANEATAKTMKSRCLGQLRKLAHEWAENADERALADSIVVDCLILDFELESEQDRRAIGRLAHHRFLRIVELMPGPRDCQVLFPFEPDIADRTGAEQRRLTPPRLAVGRAMVCYSPRLAKISFPEPDVNFDDDDDSPEPVCAEPDVPKLRYTPAMPDICPPDYEPTDYQAEHGHLSLADERHRARLFWPLYDRWDEASGNASIYDATRSLCQRLVQWGDDDAAHLLVRSALQRFDGDDRERWAEMTEELIEY